MVAIHPGAPTRRGVAPGGTITVVRRLAVVVVAAIGLTAAGCSGARKLPTPSAAFCDAATKYDTAIPTRPPIEDQIALVTRMAASAPADIKADASTFLDALERYQRGDRSVVDNPRVEKAIDNVNRRAGNGCGIYQNGPGGM